MTLRVAGSADNVMHSPAVSRRRSATTPLGSRLNSTDLHRPLRSSSMQPPPKRSSHSPADEGEGSVIDCSADGSKCAAKSWEVTLEQPVHEPSRNLPQAAVTTPFTGAPVDSSYAAADVHTVKDENHREGVSGAEATKLECKPGPFIGLGDDWGVEPEAKRQKSTPYDLSSPICAPTATITGATAAATAAVDDTAAAATAAAVDPLEIRKLCQTPSPEHIQVLLDDVPSTCPPEAQKSDTSVALGARIAVGGGKVDVEVTEVDNIVEVLEQRLLVQCDSCGKWRYVPIEYQVRKYNNHCR